MVLMLRAGLRNNLVYGKLRQISLEAGTVDFNVETDEGICSGNSEIYAMQIQSNLPNADRPRNSGSELLLQM